MIIIGLTGSIAMGKSFVAKQFEYYNINVFDCDLVISKLLNSNKDVISNIKNAFPEVVSKEDKIDKAKLSDIVFNNKSYLRILESILYPLLNKEMDNFVKKSIYNRKKMILIDIPLLFEKSYQRKFDYIIVVSASKFIQKNRVLSRKLMTESKLSTILKYQMSDYKKRKKADFIIHTGAGKAFSMREVKKLVCVK